MNSIKEINFTKYFDTNSKRSINTLTLMRYLTDHKVLIGLKNHFLKCVLNIINLTGFEKILNHFKYIFLINHLQYNVNFHKTDRLIN